ncbi:hypothetical protein [Mycobacterium sp.]|uniref:hypothetical protein n=1 Tax=Mycobacterium sp. TaxID=1785 RepID=UPI002C79D4D6|nr:hypothetical protein [Mycobacterium sp.]HKP41077.1 hypothetical protein [Mycobacterium sp.]
MTGAILVTNTGYVSETSRPRGRHRKQPPPRNIRRLAAGATAVLLGAVVLVAGALLKWATTHSVPVASPPEPPRATAAATQPERPADPISPPIDAAAPFTVDDKGFVDSSARCEATQTAVAIARTPASLVVICSDQSGQYGYRGVRLSDDAVLTTAARAAPTHVFVAQHSAVTYALSPTELLVTTGATVIKKEPMIEYRELSR